MRVGIASFEFEGVTKNGGIGTAYRLLAEALAASGAKVTVLLLQRNYTDSDFKSGEAALRAKGIALEAVPLTARYADGNPWFVGQSVAVRERLRAHQFDIVHFPENIGAAYYSLLSKKLGLDFPRTLFVVGLHGPTEWVHEASLTRFPTIEHSLLFEFEKKSAELADVVVSPSAYMLRYTRGKGWKLPGDSFVLANVNRLSGRARAGSSKAVARQLVFFGRLEARKGLFVFVEALRTYLAKEAENLREPLPVVFLGKDVRLGRGELASRFIQRELEPYASKLRIQFNNDLSSSAALEYLREHPESLVCMPSPVDNSPYVIVEALEEGLNFLASSKGGGPELIHKDDHSSALFDPTPESLATKLSERLFKAAKRIRPAPNLDKASAQWVQLHRKWYAQLQGNPKPAPSLEVRRQEDLPLISICLALGRNPLGLVEAIETMEHGLYANFELLVVADQYLPETSGCSVRRVPVERGKSWMRALATAAKGKYVLFLDQPTSLQAHALPLLLSLAETRKFDRLCSAFLRLTPDQVSQTVFPTPELALGGAMRFDPRVPLLFMSRQKFLNDCRDWNWDSVDAPFEPALWMFTSALRARPFTCVPKPLLRISEWVPSLGHLDAQMSAFCSEIDAQVPGPLGTLAASLVRANRDAIDLQNEVRAKERAMALIQRTFGSPQPHA